MKKSIHITNNSEPRGGAKLAPRLALVPRAGTSAATPARAEIATLFSHAGDPSPAALYLAGLQPSGRRSMRSRLTLAARLMAPHRRLSFESVTIVLFRLREAGAAPATVNAVLSALKGVARCAWHTGLMTAEEYQRVNDVRGVRGSRLPRGRALTGQDISSLLKACERAPEPAGSRDACLVALLAGAGLRRAEVVALDLGHYCRRDHSLRVRGKGDKERLVYLEDGGTRRALHAWLRARGTEPGPLLCPVSKQGAIALRRLSVQAVYKALQKRAREACIPRLSPHDLRRTFATLLLDEGADIGSVQSLLGHTSAETTAIYDRRGEAAKRRTSALASLPYRRRRQGREGPHE